MAANTKEKSFRTANVTKIKIFFRLYFTSTVLCAEHDNFNSVFFSDSLTLPLNTDQYSLHNTDVDTWVRNNFMNCFKLFQQRSTKK